ncbi:hypothetical protein LZ30DRAFT_409893 [Colletotrichum cereale]|nr:hypothetical protein LZ30DRAFT_409893 [Colletotrichum cereale]
MSSTTTTDTHAEASLGVLILTLLSVPETGGDTALVSQTAASAWPSLPIQTLPERLKAEHRGFSHADDARRDGRFVRREPVKSEQPIATGQKASFIDPGFTKKTIGLREEESDTLLKPLITVRSQTLCALSGKRDGGVVERPRNGAHGHLGLQRPQATGRAVARAPDHKSGG